MVLSYAQLKFENRISNFPPCMRNNNHDVITFSADDKMIFNKDDLSLITISRQDWYCLVETVFFMNFLKKVYRTIEPIDCKTWYQLISRQTKQHGVGMPSTSCTTENVYAVEAYIPIESRRPTWHPQNNSWNNQRNWYFATVMTS